MPDQLLTDDLAARLAQLTPERRALVERALRQAAATAADPGTAEPASGSAAITRRAPGTPVPLTPGQEVLWTLQRALPELTAYNVPRVLAVCGALDVDALRAALDAIVARHEVLRTRYLATGDGPLQVIDAVAGAAFELIDLRETMAGASDEAREAESRRLVGERIRVPFDLACDAPLRATLVRVAEESWHLVLITHHIASDEGSRDILFRELERLYAGARRGALDEAIAALPSLAVQYGDYAAWQEHELSRGALDAQLAYWRERLAGLPALDLPTDRRGGATPDFGGARLRLVLPVETREAVRRVAKSANASPFMVLVAAVDALLYRYTAQDDIAIGTSVAGRRHPELDGLIGYFPAQVVLRTVVDPAAPFTALVERVRDTVLGAFEHQDVPIERLMQEVTDRVDPRAPLFRVSAQMAGDAKSAPALDGVELRPVATDAGNAKFDLLFGFDDAADGLRVLIEYRTELFDAATIERMGAHLGELLAGIAADASTPVAELPLLSLAERAQLLDGWAGERVSYAGGDTLVALLGAQAARTPGAVACEDARRTLTYAELDAASTRLARRLRAAGVGTGALVGVCAERSVELVVALVAVVKAGGAYVPLDPEYPAERLAFMLEDAAVAMLLTTPATESVLTAVLPAGATLRVLSLAGVAEATSAEGRRTDGPLPLPGADDPAYMIYTSGSTGRPKGALNAHRGIVNRLQWMQAEYQLTPNDVVLQKTPFSFDVSVWEFFWPLMTGARLVLARPGGHRDTSYLTETMQAHGVTVCHFVPSMLRAFLADDQAGGCTTLRAVMASGEALAPDLVAQFYTALPTSRLHNLYGPTECAVDVSYWPCPPSTEPPAVVPIGRAVANTRLYVLDGRGQPAPIGVPGELFLAGVQVGLGYHGRPELTAERFVSDPYAPEHEGKSARMYRTGDRARWRADGTVEYLGRLDFQVKLRGFRIELGEIESALAAEPSVQSVAVLVREDVPGDQRLVAYVVPADGAERSAATLRAALQSRLPDYMVPAAFVFLDALPLSSNGKLERRALPAPDLAAERAVAYVAPRTPLEQQVADVWATVLGVDRVGANDDFFALGGHSLLAMRAIARLAAVLPARVTIGAMFEARTVAALAAHVEAQAAPSTAANAVRIERAAERGVAPLSAAQQAVWTAEQRSPDTAAYNAPIVLRVRGALDTDALERALAAVVARHEVLRTAFEERGGEAVQVVHPSVVVPLERADLRDDASRLDDLLRRTVQRPFDLTRAPLLRALAARTGEAEWVVAIVVHHLVFDGGSEPLLKRDLAAAYAAIVAGGRPALAPLPIEFADYARWEQAQRESGALDRDLAYWRDALAGAPAAIDIPADWPVDGPRDARADDAAARATVVFPPALVDALARLAREQNATMFMVLLAGYQALLSRFSRQEDLVIGAPVSGRDRPETQQLIGFLANTLPLRATIERHTTFATLVAQARERLLAGFAHAAVPVERVSAELGRGALFDTLFVLQEGGDAASPFAGCETEAMAVEIGAAKLDLSLSMTVTPLGLRAVLIYRTARFRPETAERLLEHLGRLLASLAAAPSLAIADHPLLGAADRAQLTRWNDTRVEYGEDCTLTALIDATVARTPSALAVEDEHESLTYAALDARAAHLAAALRAHGVGAGTLVGICAERAVGMVVGLLGILKAGGAYVPIDPEYPAERVTYMLADSAVPVLLTQTHLAGSLPAHEARVLLLDDPAMPWASDAAGAAPDLAPVATPGDPAYMIYTSGSTGRPKGAVNAHRGIVNRLRWMQAEYQLSPQDVVLQKTPFSFDVSVWEFFWPLITGARLVLARPGGHRDPAYLTVTVRRREVTVCHFVPSMLRVFLADAEAPRCATLRAVMASGEALAPDLAAQFYAVLPESRLHNLYGPTECAVDVSYWPCPPTAVAPAVVPIGRPVANTRLHVLDADLREVPIGVAGELHIGGVQVGLGYHGRPDLTAERFVRDPFAEGGRDGDDRRGSLYKTGDLARWRHDGAIEYLGRLDFQVKLRGFRIELGEIEQHVAALPRVSGALAMLHEDPALGPRLVCYYVDATAVVTPEQVVAALRRELPEHMVPSAVVRLDAWPLSPNGKVDRRALPAPELAGAGDDAGVAPRTAVERVLARLVADTLGRERVGATSDFFALGGHSLLATRVVTQASRLFRVSLTLRGFFAAPSVAGLADAVTAAVGAERAEKIATLVEKVQRMTPEERDRLRSEQGHAKQGTGIS